MTKGMVAVSSLTLAVALVSQGALPAGPPSASTPASPATASSLPESLDEIVVNGVRRKPVRDKREVLSWMLRLAGSHVATGRMEMTQGGVTGISEEVMGNADCAPIGRSPAVSCSLKIGWGSLRGPDGKSLPAEGSFLHPASLVFGFEPERIGIRFMLLDSQGIGDVAEGLLYGDALVARSRCAATSADCVRTTQIVADPGLEAASIRMELVVRGSRAAVISIALHRLANDRAQVGGSAP